MRGSRLCGPFSAQMKTPSLCFSPYSPGFICNLRYWQLLILDPAPRPGPPGQDTAVGFVFGHVFLLLGVHLCEARAQRGPLVQCRVLGSIKIEPAGQHILVLSAPELDILFHCWTLGEAEWLKKRHTEKKRVRDFTLEPNHMVSIGEGGEFLVWFDTYGF